MRIKFARQEKLHRLICAARGCEWELSARDTVRGRAGHLRESWEGAIPGIVFPPSIEIKKNKKKRTNGILHTEKPSEKKIARREKKKRMKKFTNQKIYASTIRRVRRDTKYVRAISPPVRIASFLFVCFYGVTERAKRKRWNLRIDGAGMSALGTATHDNRDRKNEPGIGR